MFRAAPRFDDSQARYFSEDQQCINKIIHKKLDDCFAKSKEGIYSDLDVARIKGTILQGLREKVMSGQRPEFLKDFASLSKERLSTCCYIAIKIYNPFSAETNRIPHHLNNSHNEGVEGDIPVTDEEMHLLMESLGSTSSPTNAQSWPLSESEMNSDTVYRAFLKEQLGSPVSVLPHSIFNPGITGSTQLPSETEQLNETYQPYT